MNPLRALVRVRAASVVRTLGSIAHEAVALDAVQVPQGSAVSSGWGLVSSWSVSIDWVSWEVEVSSAGGSDFSRQAGSVVRLKRARRIGR